MELLQLTQTPSNGIDFIESRSNLFYNKYQYKASFYLSGLPLLWFCNTKEEVLQKYEKNPKRFKGADIDSIVRVFDWLTIQNKKPEKEFTKRMEANSMSVFSNDLNFLKTLESINVKILYTEVDLSIPQGTKYFKNKPKHNYRVHLKSKRVSDDFALKLGTWFDRYKGTDTVIAPSAALKEWVDSAKSLQKSGYGSSWRLRYSSSHYFFDYDNESTLMLFMIMFDSMISRKYKLEKRP